MDRDVDDNNGNESNDIDENNVDNGQNDGSKRFTIPTWVYVVVLAMLIVTGFCLYFRYYYVQPNTPTIKPSSNQYHSIYAWSDPTNVAGATATGYQFPVLKNPDGTLKLVPATLNNDKLANPAKYNITVSPTPFPCIDIDQLNAIQTEHTCVEYAQSGNAPGNSTNVTSTSSTNGPNNEPIFCVKLDGKKADINETETYYTTCNAKGVSKKTTLYCPGQVGGIAVNFNQTATTGKYDTLYCLKRNSDNSVVATQCDLSNPDFQFRTVLTTPKTWPAYGTSYGSTGMTGTLAAFIHRATGLCLDVFDPTNKGSQKLTLRDCNSTYNYGYTWQLFSPTNLSCVFIGSTNSLPCTQNYQSYQYDPTQPNGVGTNSAGCPLVSCLDAQSWDKTPIDSSSSVYNYTTMSPQQIVYIGYAGGAEQTYVPKSILDTVSFFYQYNGMSITCDTTKPIGTTNPPQYSPITQPFARWQTYNGNSLTPIINNKIFNSQIASFLTYNFIYGSTYSSPFSF